MNIQKKIVISAVNLFEGGTLTILKTNLKYANDHLSGKYDIIALIHKKEILPIEELGNISFIEYPKSRKSYFNRLYLEYYAFKNLSKKLKPYLWFSLHDITPNVIADIRVVYCHNSTPFKKLQWSDLYFQPTVFFFTLFYKFLYAINIKKNNFVVVQQKWLKREFVKNFNLAEDKVVVCYPSTQQYSKKLLDNPKALDLSSKITFFYPALPRPFKNFEVIGEAVEILNKRGITDFSVEITIKGDENRYAKYIHRKYHHLNNIHFIGNLSLEEVHSKYEQVNALIFPSTLETWGLPISEFKAYQKPILLSKLPYAGETLGFYDKGCFFNPYNPNELADKMQNFINGRLIFDSAEPIKDSILNGWAELYEKILE